MEHRPLTPDFAVAGQITPEQIAEIKAAGYRSVICNRPDDEQPGQPSVAAVRAAAEAAGLAFRHIPVSGGIFPPDAVAATAAALDELEGPIFAYCRSGARSTTLYSMAQQLKG